MGAPLRNPPVYCTVAQVKFNTILKLSEFLPPIQELLRNAGFPDFIPQKMILLQVLNQNGQLTPLPTQQDRYSFGNVERTHILVLEADKLSLQSTKYGSFEHFLETFMKGLSIVHQVVRLDFVERIGLRYLDRVFPGMADKLSDYLQSDVMELGNRLGGKVGHSFSETHCEVGAIKIVARALAQTGGIAFPPDLQPGSLIVDPRLADYNGLSAVLDTDGSYEVREIYSADAVMRHLSDIHSLINTVFKATVTDYAFKVWK